MLYFMHMTKQYFDQAWLDAQKQKLAEEKKRLQSELGKRATVSTTDISDYHPKYEDYGTDEESNAAEYAEAETNIDVVENLEEELRKVNQALSNIESGSYGLDINTGKPINKKRLEAYPAAQIDV